MLQRSTFQRPCPMNILIVTRGFYPAVDFGGPAIAVYHIASRLAARGHAVTVYTSNLRNAKEKLYDRTTERQVEGVQVVYFNSLWHYNYAAVTPDLIGCCRRELADFDIVNIYGYREFMTLVVAAYARRYGVPYVLQPLGNLPRYSRSRGLKFIYDRLFQRPLLGSAARVIARSPLEAQQLPSFGIPPEKTVVVPNGIDLAEFQRDSVVPGAFRRRYGIAGSERVILYLGRLARIKSLDLLLHAFARLNHKARLVIVGPAVEPDYQRELQHLCGHLGIADRTIFTGPLYSREKLSAYVDADVFVAPSTIETYGLAIAEAIACGTPVVVTKSCGLSPLVKDQVGLVVEHDAHDLAEAIDRILSDEDLTFSFRSRCSYLAKSALSWDAAVEKLEEALSSAISTHNQ